MPRLQPERLWQTVAGLGAWRVLCAAVELGVFSELGRGPRSCEQLCRRLGLDRQLAPTLLDTLLGLGWLEREGDDDQAIYVNSREAGQFLDARQPAFLGALLAGAEAGWLQSPQGLAAALRQAARPAGVEPSPAFAIAQARAHGLALAGRLDFGRWSCLQVEAATPGIAAALAAPLLAGHPHLIASAAAPCDGPPADVRVLHLVGSSPAARGRSGLQRAAAALPPEGCLILIDHLLDETRRHNAPALLHALARQVEGGPDPPPTLRALRQRAGEAGLVDEQEVPLGGGATALVLRH